MLASCPSAARLMQGLQGCEAGDVVVREVCEGSGACGTDNAVNNCVYFTSTGQRHSYDIYERVECTPAPASPPLPPRSPPPPALPACQACDAGMVQCGYCLNLVPHQQCPDGPHAVHVPKCADGDVALGGLCEGDGGCGTTPAANNCRYREVATFVYHDCADLGARPLGCLRPLAATSTLPCLVLTQKCHVPPMRVQGTFTDARCAALSRRIHLHRRPGRRRLSHSPRRPSRRRRGHARRPRRRPCLPARIAMLGSLAGCACSWWALQSAPMASMLSLSARAPPVRCAPAPCVRAMASAAPANAPTTVSTRTPAARRWRSRSIASSFACRHRRHRRRCPRPRPRHQRARRLWCACRLPQASHRARAHRQACHHSRCHWV